MDPNGKISRKDFFKLLFQFLLIPFAVFSYFSVTGNRKTSNKTLTLKLSSLSKGFYAYGDYLISNDSGLKILSSKCSHLGCKINSVKEGTAICQCHGSKFNSEGIPVNGPAYKRLRELEYSISKESGELTINDSG